MPAVLPAEDPAVFLVGTGPPVWKADNGFGAGASGAWAVTDRRPLGGGVGGAGAWAESAGASGTVICALQAGHGICWPDQAESAAMRWLQLGQANLNSLMGRAR